MSIGRVPGVTGIQPSIVDAKGDLIVATAADSVDRLAVGTNGHTLVADSATATGLKWAAPAGGGKVLQVVSVEYSTSTTIATSSYTDTGLSASITPSATSSKILIIITQQVFMTRQSNSAVNSDYRVLRGATQIGATGALTQISGGTDSAGSLTIRYPLAFTFLDSPNTTSSTTYKSQIAIGQTSNSGNIVCQSNTTASTITLIEIGA